jgi:hypothetical protein
MWKSARWFSWLTKMRGGTLPNYFIQVERRERGLMKEKGREREKKRQERRSRMERCWWNIPKTFPYGVFKELSRRAVLLLHSESSSIKSDPRLILILKYTHTSLHNKDRQSVVHCVIIFISRHCEHTDTHHPIGVRIHRLLLT